MMTLVALCCIVLVFMFNGSCVFATVNDQDTFAIANCEMMCEGAILNQKELSTRSCLVGCNCGSTELTCEDFCLDVNAFAAGDYSDMVSTGSEFLRIDRFESPSSFELTKDHLALNGIDRGARMTECLRGCGYRDVCQVPEDPCQSSPCVFGTCTSEGMGPGSYTCAQKDFTPADETVLSCLSSCGCAPDHIQYAYPGAYFGVANYIFQSEQYGAPFMRNYIGELQLYYSSQKLNIGSIHAAPSFAAYKRDGYTNSVRISSTRSAEFTLYHAQTDPANFIQNFCTMIDDYHECAMGCLCDEPEEQTCESFCSDGASGLTVPGWETRSSVPLQYSFDLTYGIYGYSSYKWFYSTGLLSWQNVGSYRRRSSSAYPTFATYIEGVTSLSGWRTMGKYLMNQPSFAAPSDLFLGFSDLEAHENCMLGCAYRGVCAKSELPCDGMCTEDEVCRGSASGPSTQCVPIDPCVSSVCENGATCTNTHPGAYTCTCPSGFYGVHCHLTTFAEMSMSMAATHDLALCEHTCANDFAFPINGPHACAFGCNCNVEAMSCDRFCRGNTFFSGGIHDLSELYLSATHSRFQYLASFQSNYKYDFNSGAVNSFSHLMKLADAQTEYYLITNRQGCIAGCNERSVCQSYEPCMSSPCPATSTCEEDLHGGYVCTTFDHFNPTNLAEEACMIECGCPKPGEEIHTSGYQIQQLLGRSSQISSLNHWYYPGGVQYNGGMVGNGPAIIWRTQRTNMHLSKKKTNQDENMYVCSTDFAFECALGCTCSDNAATCDDYCGAGDTAFSYPVWTTRDSVNLTHSYMSRDSVSAFWNSDPNIDTITFTAGNGGTLLYRLTSSMGRYYKNSGFKSNSLTQKGLYYDSAGFGSLAGEEKDACVSGCLSRGICHAQPLCDGLCSANEECVWSEDGAYTVCRSSNACLSNPCQNDGTCSEPFNTAYECTCDNGFTGTHCEMDILPPQVEACPESMTLVTSGEATAFANWTSPLFTDNDEVAVIVTQNANLTDFAVGITVVSYTAVDNTGLNSSCIFTINVSDADAPVLKCPKNVTAFTAVGASNAIVIFDDLTAIDNIDSSVTVLVNGGASGDSFSEGITVLSANATDSAGNTATCQFAIEVIRVSDADAPVLKCPTNITAFTAVGASNAIVIFDDLTAIDNIDSSVTVLVNGGASGDSFSEGITVLSANATDSAGNTATCQFSIEVIRVSSCQSSPCQNGASCVFDSGACSCTTGYDGNYCENIIDFCTPAACANNGTCINIPELASVACACSVGFYGDACENEVQKEAAVTLQITHQNLGNNENSEQDIADVLAYLVAVSGGNAQQFNVSIDESVDDEGNVIYVFIVEVYSTDDFNATEIASAVLGDSSSDFSTKVISSGPEAEDTTTTTTKTQDDTGLIIGLVACGVVLFIGLAMAIAYSKRTVIMNNGKSFVMPV